MPDDRLGNLSSDPSSSGQLSPGSGRLIWLGGLAALVCGAALSPFVMIGLLGVALVVGGGVALVLAEAVASAAAFMRRTERRLGLVRVALGCVLGLLGVLVIIVAAFVAPFGFLTERLWEVSEYRFSIPLRIFSGDFAGGTIPLPVLWLGGPTLIGIGAQLRSSLPYRQELRLAFWAFVAPLAAAIGFWILSNALPLSA